jgi:AcrR family transcriptional regulator/DNA-binding MarR family transcriptional regulator
MPGTGAATSEGAAPAGLTSGREDFPYADVQQIQRARLVAAMAQVACERGAARVTIADVVERAGVSRRTFYEFFKDREDCLLFALEDAVTRVSARVLPAYEMAQGGWRVRIRAGLVALLGFFDEQPHLARFLLVEWLASGSRSLERRQRVLELIAGAVEESRAEPNEDSGPPGLVAEGVVGAVASVLHTRVARSQPIAALIELVNPLMSIVVLPYLGAAAARKELERPVPDIHHDDREDRAPENLFKGLEMRLTYRTMRVLAAVASHPGDSNRTIADAAGIGDQGQISKLLMRLRKLGLIENERAGTSTKGEPNAWSLTTTGRQVEHSLRISPDGHLSRPAVSQR